MEAASFFAQDSTLDSLRTYVVQDLADAAPTTVEDWAELYLGVEHTLLERWSAKIAKERWFEDPTVQNALEQYCLAKTEAARYQPFVNLVTRIMEKARTTLNLHGPGNSFPIANVGLFKSAGRPIEPIREHGALGAERKPDVILMRKAAMPPEGSEMEVRWTDVLSWFELKYDSFLHSELNRARSARGLFPASRDTKTITPGASEPADACAVDAKATAKGTGSAGASSGGTPVVRGTKRRRDSRPVEDSLRQMKTRLENGTFQFDPTNRGSSVNLSGGLGALQSASYALELLSCTYGSRVSCFGVVVEDDHFYLWHYDACGIAYTARRLSFVSDFEAAAAILVAIFDCTPERFGAFPSSVMQPTNPYSQCFPPPDLNGNTFDVTSIRDKQTLSVTLKDPVSTRYSITGRRSFIYTADVNPSREAMKGGRVIVKFSYQVSTRSSEHGLVEHAQACGVDRLPGLHASADLWTLRDGTREIAFRRQQRASNASKRDLIKQLSAERNAQGFLEYEDRVLRAIVYTEYGSISTLFSQHIELVPIMVDQMIDCLHDLRYKAKILHRDVSINNIMYEIRDGTYHFVLIDFDMAISLDDAISADGSYVASSKNRTGTLPFMAHELVRDAAKAWHSASDWVPIRHLLRHEYESLFYVSFWSVTALVYPKGNDPIHRFLYEGAKRLENGTLLALAIQKEGICRHRLDENLIFLQGPAEILKKWFMAWWRLFIVVGSALDAHDMQCIDNKGNLVLPVPPFDLETANGTFSRDTLKAALTPHIPDVSWKTARKLPPHALPVDAPETSFPETIVAPRTSRKKRTARGHPGSDRSAEGPNKQTKREALKRGARRP